MVWRKRTRRRGKSGKAKGFSKAFGRHGVHHEADVSFSLNDSQNCTVLPLLACDSTLNNPDSVYVHPKHASRDSSGGVRNDHLTYGSSVVKKIHYDMNIYTDEAFSGWAIKGFCFPIMLRYDDLDREYGGELVTSYLPVTIEGSDEKIRPDFSGTDLPLNGDKSSDLWDSDGLTGGSSIEQTTFSHLSFETALGEKAISPKLLSVTGGGIKDFIVRKEYPVNINTTIPVPSKVQLQTEKTFFGLCIGMYADSDHKQFHNNGVTGHNLEFDFGFSFFEKNKEFKQTVS